MTGDFKDPYVTDSSHLVNCYEETIKSVKLALPVMYKKILKIICDLAQLEMQKGIQHVRNYYVLTLIMAGMIDDFKDALNEMLRAANLPISIIVIKMGKNQEENDS